MKRERTVLLPLFLSLLGGLALAWLAFWSGPSDVTLRASSARLRAPRIERWSSARQAGPSVQRVPVRGGERTPLADGDEACDRPAQPALVRLHGLVSRNGRPVEGFDLAFHSSGARTDVEDDWDFTGEEGRYEVQLAAASYEVYGSDGAWLARVVIPAGRGQFVLDIDLPLGDEGHARR